MPRRGRCRCGHILVFHRSPQGYKVRCPECLAVVRLSARTKSSVPVHHPPDDPNTFAVTQFLDEDEDEANRRRGLP